VGRVETPRRDTLSSEELVIVRELIAEYQYDQARSRFLGTTWKRGRAVLVGVAAVLVFTMQLVTTLVLVTGGHP
jgi:hypothetical protein